MKSRRRAPRGGAKPPKGMPAKEPKAANRARQPRGMAASRKKALEVRLELVQELHVKVGRKPPLAESFMAAPDIALAQTDLTGPGSIRCRISAVSVSVDGGQALLTRRLKLVIKYSEFARALEGLADSGAYRPDWFERLGARFGFNGQSFVRQFLDGGDWLSSRKRGDSFGWIPTGAKVSVRLRLADAHFDPGAAAD